MFPKELWPVLEGESGEEARKHINRIIEKRAAIMGGAAQDSDEKTRIILEKIKNATGVEEDAELEEEDELAEEELRDDDWEEDEEEMGGDYDGEKYFDNGEGDSDDGGGGGGGDEY